jgi:catechol 2,3-dioxygenase-like lactoylglutathione lyase family enzyme
VELNRLITGAHAIVFSGDAAADRAFFRDVLGLDSIDAGGGWLIFSLPPAELAVHPAENARHELYLMCDDLEATLAELGRKGVEPTGPVSEQSWGRLASIRLPGGGDLGVYQPTHPTPPHR